MQLNYVTCRGDFSNNLIHGRGIMKYSNGDVYEGEWENGLVCSDVHCYNSSQCFVIEMLIVQTDF